MAQVMFKGELIEIDLPAITPITLPKTWQSARMFMEEFSIEERVAMREFAKVDVLAEDFLDLLKGVNYVVANDAQLIAALDYFVANEVLAPERPAQVLGT